MVINKNSETIKSSKWYLVSNILLKIIDYISLAIFAKLLTKNEFGEYSQYIAWSQILVIITTFNLNASIISGKYDYKEVFDKFILSTLSLTFIVTTCFWLFSDIICKIFSYNVSIQFFYANCMFIYIIFYSAINLYKLRDKFLVNYKRNTRISILYALCLVIVQTIFVLLLHDKLKGIILGLVISTSIVGTFAIIDIIKKGKSASTKYWEYAINVSLPYIPHALSMVVLSSTDKIMISRLCGNDKTALYSLAYSCSLIITILMNSLNDAYVPWLGNKIENKEYEKIKDNSKKYILFFTILSFGIMLIMPEILYAIGGEEYYEAIGVLAPVALGIIYQFLYIMFVNVEQLTKKTKYMALCSALAAILNIVLNYIFIPIFGYMAAAYTTAIGYCFLLVMHMHIVKKIGYGKIYNYKFVNLTILLSLFLSIAVGILYKYYFIRIVAIALYVIAMIIAFYKKRNTKLFQ